MASGSPAPSESVRRLSLRESSDPIVVGTRIGSVPRIGPSAPVGSDDLGHHPPFQTAVWRPDRSAGNRRRLVPAVSHPGPGSDKAHAQHQCGRRIGQGNAAENAAPTRAGHAARARRQAVAGLRRCPAVRRVVACNHARLARAGRAGPRGTVPFSLTRKSGQSPAHNSAQSPARKSAALAPPASSSMHNRRSVPWMSRIAHVELLASTSPASIASSRANRPASIAPSQSSPISSCSSSNSSMASVMSDLPP